MHIKHKRQHLFTFFFKISNALLVWLVPCFILMGTPAASLCVPSLASSCGFSVAVLSHHFSLFLHQFVSVHQSRLCLIRNGSIFVMFYANRRNMIANTNVTTRLRSVVTIVSTHFATQIIFSKMLNYHAIHKLVCKNMFLK